jgi:hypothetical protein
MDGLMNKRMRRKMTKKPAARGVNNIGSAMGDDRERPVGSKKAKQIKEKELKSSQHPDLVTL